MSSRYCRYYLCLLILWAGVSGFAAEKPKLQVFWKDAGAFYSAPIRWKGADWLQAGIVAGTGVLLYFADQKIFDQVQKGKSDVTRRLADASRWMGDGRIVLPVLGLVGLLASARKDSRLSWACFTAGEAFVLANSWTIFFKWVGHRARPYTGKGPEKWRGPRMDFDNAYLSMPSGHTSSAWAVASGIAAYYSDRKWISGFLMVLAGLTGWSRVHDQKHWPSDVWIGACLGYFTAQFLKGRHGSANGEMANGAGFRMAAVQNRIQISLRF